jgi:hypothetical protein
MAVPFSFPSDTIAFETIKTGAASVGNGGNGTNNGNIINEPTLKFAPSNSAVGASVSVSTGDHVHQSASWNAGGANAGDPPSISKVLGGTATSSGDQYSQSGHDTSTVHANTMATQTNEVWADQSQQVYAGIGGNGGSYDAAETGSVYVDLLSMPSEPIA